mgnify:CR=1 FL=1
MQMKIKEKMIAVVMAFAMMFTFIFAGESSEVIAAAKTKALEINVDFARNAASGDDSGIYVKSLISNKKITFGKTYVFQTKIYVLSRLLPDIFHYFCHSPAFVDILFLQY